MSTATPPGLTRAGRSLINDRGFGNLKGDARRQQGARARQREGETTRKTDEKGHRNISIQSTPV